MNKEKPDYSGGDDGNNDGSSGTESGSELDDSSSNSGADHVPWDTEECERGRERCVRDLIALERQFQDLKERFYRERVLHIDTQLHQVRNGTAGEYLKKLTALEDNWRTRNEVADVLKKLQLAQLERLYEGEYSAVEQHYENAQRLLYEQLKDDIENRISKLEADKRNADINLELWIQDSNREKAKGRTIVDGEKLKRPLSPSNIDHALSPTEKRRKPVSVSGPFVVYMLKEADVLDDWNVIRRAALQADYCDRINCKA